jgi:hypothetical protein
MAYDPAERFADAGEMASALDRATGSEAALYAPVPLAAAAAGDDDRTLLQVTSPPAPPPPPARDRPSRRVAERRQRSGFPTWLGVLLILVLAGVAGLWAMSRRGGGPASGPDDTSPFPDSAAEATGLEPDASAGDEEEEAATQEEPAATAPEVRGGEERGEGPGRGRGKDRGRGKGNGPGKEPPGQAKKRADNLDGGGALLPVLPLPMNPGAQPASPVPATQAQPETTTTIVPATAESAPPASPTPEPATRDTLVTVPSPPPRLLGRPAHPDSAHSDH